MNRYSILLQNAIDMLIETKINNGVLPNIAVITVLSEMGTNEEELRSMEVNPRNYLAGIYSNKEFVKILQQNTYCYITVDDYAEGVAEIISVSPENATVEVRWKLFSPCYSCQKVPDNIYESSDIIPFELLHNEGKTIKGVDKEVKEGKYHGIKI